MALMTHNSRLGKKNAAKMAMFEEEERKRREEEQRKAALEEARKMAAQQKDNETKGQKTQRQIQQLEIEKLRSEVRTKIETRIAEVMRQEEENARKPAEESKDELDEEMIDAILREDALQEEEAANAERDAEADQDDAIEASQDGISQAQAIL